jgi:hypothetical protein
VSHLPRTIPQATAAVLSGLSPVTFRRRTLPLLMTARSPGGRRQIVLEDLERHLGRRISASEYLAAERARDPARHYQTRYRRRTKDDARDDQPAA